MITAGIAVFIGSAISETFFTEKRMIQLIALSSLVSLFFLFKIGKEPQQKVLVLISVNIIGGQF